MNIHNIPGRRAACVPLIPRSKTPLRRLLAGGVVASCAASTLMVLGGACASASTVTATSTSGAVSKSFSGAWYGLSSEAGALATIKWSSGPDAADNKSFCDPPCPEGEEPKFKKDANGSLAPRDFAGFDYTTPQGPLGSTSITKGTGKSQLGNDSSSGSMVRIRRGAQPAPLPDSVEATWTLTADGNLGVAQNNLEPSWVSRATGTDPWFLLPGDFQQGGISGNFDLFVPFELDQASFSPRGSAELSASYQSSTGVVPLLDILLDSLGATVTPGALPGLEYYELVPDAGGNSATYQPVDIGTISMLFQNDLANGSLSAPISLGVLLPSLPVPTVPIDPNGAVAAISVTASTSDSAVAPEPSSWILVFAGVGLVTVRWCGKRKSGTRDR